MHFHSLWLEQKVTQGFLITKLYKKWVTYMPLQPIAFYIQTSHLICSVNQMTGLYMKCKTGLKQDMGCILPFGISHYLAFLWLFECMQMHANNFFYIHVVSTRFYPLAWRSNGFIKFHTLECQSNGLGA